MPLRNENNILFQVETQFWGKDVPDEIAMKDHHVVLFHEKMKETSKKCKPTEIIEYLLYDLYYNMYDDSHEELLKILYDRVSTLEKILE